MIATRPPNRHDLALAAALALVAFGVYVRTLYPGLVGSGDTPELQFSGRVLGIPHAPGYPVYTLLSWGFSQIPFGNVAWRANLLSAVAAALAVALIFLASRGLDARRAAAAATALGFGFGRVFWSQATLAEVYTLATALLLGVVVALLAWSRSRREGTLLAAVACAALGLAHHHVDVVAAAAGFVLFALATEPGLLRRPRLLARAVSILVAGLAFYGLIPLRTAQGAAYLASPASDARELFDVVRGAAYQGRLFAFDARVVLTERLPRFASHLVDEITLPGALLLLLGLGVTLRRAPRQALLLAGAAGGIAVFALNYDVRDEEVFLLPSLALLWPLVAVGLDVLLALAGRRSGLAAPFVFLLPLAQLAANHRQNDHSDRTFEMRYFRAVFEQLPSRAVFVNESYTVDQMVRYELLGEGFARDRDVRFSGRDEVSLDFYRERGYAVFAFERGRDELALRGHVLAPVVLPDQALAEFVAAPPRGGIVAVAQRAADGRCSGIVRGVASGAEERRSGALVDLHLANGAAIGAGAETLPAEIRVVCRADGAAVEIDGRLVASVDAGAAIAVLNARGRVVVRHEVTLAAGGRVPFARAFPLHQLVAPADCVDIAEPSFRDVSAQAAGGRLLVRAEGSRTPRLVAYLAGDRPLRPRVARDLPGRPAVASQGFGHDPGEASRRDLERALAADGLTGLRPTTGGPAVVRVEIAEQTDPRPFALDLGGSPARVWLGAPEALAGSSRVQVCAQPVGGVPLLATVSQSVARIVGDAEGAPYFGSGWGELDRDGPVPFRAGSQGDVLLPLHEALPLRVRARVRSRTDEAVEVGARLNGRELAGCNAGRFWAFCEWRTEAEDWRPGLNTMRFGAASASASAAPVFELGEVRIERNEAPAPR